MADDDTVTAEEYNRLIEQAMGDHVGPDPMDRIDWLFVTGVIAAALWAFVGLITGAHTTRDTLLIANGMVAASIPFHLWRGHI